MVIAHLAVRFERFSGLSCRSFGYASKPIKNPDCIAVRDEFFLTV